MRTVTVKVEVDLEEIVGQLDEEDLEALGLVEADSIEDLTDPTDWQAIADAIRRADFRKAEELINEAASDSDVNLPPFSMARVA